MFKYFIINILFISFIIADQDFSISQLSTLIRVNEADYELHEDCIEVKTKPSKEWPGINFNNPKTWYIIGVMSLQLPVKNLLNKPLEVFLRIDSKGKSVTEKLILKPKEKGFLNLKISKTPWHLDQKIKLDGLFKYPNLPKVNTSKITSLRIFLNQPKSKAHFLIGNIIKSGNSKLLPTKMFLPFVDEFGQFTHADWPGKIKSSDDLKSDKHKECIEVKNEFQFNEFGGWQNGPQQEGSGFFLTQKIDGQWWFIDPDGKIFWSNGINCITTDNQTGITNRENYFVNLPKKGDPLSKFYQDNWWAPIGFYAGGEKFKTYNFLEANLLRKYGKDWLTTYPGIVHKRLKNWGINTFGNWSSPELMVSHQTPYTVPIHVGGKNIEGSSGYWGKFIDVFHKDFPKKAKKQIREKLQLINSKWCIGVFIDNELSWGKTNTALAEATLMSPANQPAKRVFVDDLKSKYRDIQNLNAAWKANFKNWKDLLAKKVSTKGFQAQNDLIKFNQKIAETYFSTMRYALKLQAPQALYLGCRFADMNNVALEAAEKYCDVVSINKYAKSIDVIQLPEDFNKPVIIGEFHFGALDRGSFNSGLQNGLTQEGRAKAYTSYMNDALKHPNIVGAHWFQYCDQPVSGRIDGENFQIGFISITDKPYQEMIEASQKFASQMYQKRADH